MPKFDVTAQITGGDGNALVIMSKVSRAIKRAGGTEEDCREFRNAVFDCPSYGAVLTLCGEWVDLA